MIEFGAFLLSPSPTHIRGGGAASSYIWIVGLAIREMVTTWVWERGQQGEVMRGGGARSHHEATEVLTTSGYMVVLCKRLIGEVVQSKRRPLLGPFPG